MSSKLVISRQLLEEVMSTVCLYREVHLCLDKDCIQVEAVDGARISKTNIILPSQALKYYQPSDTRISINPQYFFDVLQLTRPEDDIYICYNEKTNRIQIRSDMLQYTITPHGASSLPYDFDPDPPDQYAIFELDITDMPSVLKLSNNIAQICSMKFKSRNRSLVFTTKGDNDSLRYTTFVELSELGLLLDKPREYKITSHFDIDYLYPITRILPKDRSVNIIMGDASSLIIEFPIANSIGSVRFIIENSIRPP
jgi:hypothetical protein